MCMCASSILGNNSTLSISPFQSIQVLIPQKEESSIFNQNTGTTSQTTYSHNPEDHISVMMWQTQVHSRQLDPSSGLTEHSVCAKDAVYTTNETGRCLNEEMHAYTRSGWCSWLRHHATSQKIVGLIPNIILPATLGSWSSPSL